MAFLFLFLSFPMAVSANRSCQSRTPCTWCWADSSVCVGLSGNILSILHNISGNNSHLHSNVSNRTQNPTQVWLLFCPSGCCLQSSAWFSERCCSSSTVWVTVLGLHLPDKAQCVWESRDAAAVTVPILALGTLCSAWHSTGGGLAAPAALPELLSSASSE